MAPFKSNELKSDWRSDFLIEETDCDCEGCGQDPCIKCGESHHNINEEVQGGVSVETYTKDTKFTEIETVDIIKAKPLVTEKSDWRSDFLSEADLVDEGLLKGALSGAKLVAKYTPKVTKAVFKGGQALARKGAGDIAKFKKTRELIRRVNNIADIRATKSLEPIKPIKVKWNPTIPPKSKPSVTTSTTKALPGFAKIDPPKIKWNATVPPKSKPSITTTTKKITGSAGTQYKKPIGANPTAKTQYKEPIGANPTAKTQYKEPITPKYSRSQKSALTGKAQKIIDQIRGKTPGAKLSAKMTKALDSSTKKGTYSDKVNQLLKVPDPKPTVDGDKVRAAVAGASFGLGSYGGYEFSKKVGLIGKKEKKEVKEAIALAVPAGIGLGKTALKVGGAVLAAKGGEKILKKLLGTKKKPKATDWDTNPKDDVDRELNVKQRQAKDAAKNKSFDDEMSAFRKAKEAGNLNSDEIKTQLKKNAQIKKDLNPKVKKESFSNWRSEINL